MNKNEQLYLIYGHTITYRGCLVVTFDDEETDKINMLIENNNLLKYIPNKSIQSKINRDTTSYHLTFVGPDEFREDLELLGLGLGQELEQIKRVEINIIGLGENKNCFYLICQSKQLDILRNDMKLNKTKDYHITLGFDTIDHHDISKSLSTLIHSLSCVTNEHEDKITDIIISNFGPNNQKNIKLLLELYNMKQSNQKKSEENTIFDQTIYKIIRNLINQYCVVANYDKALNYTYELIQLNPQNIIGYYMQIKILNHLKCINENIIDETIKALLQLTNVKSNPISNELINTINSFIINSHTTTNQTKQVNLNKSLDILLLNEQNKIILSELPTNFSNIGYDHNIFGSGIVSTRHIKLLSSFGINNIINLIGEEKPKTELLDEAKKYNVKIHHIGFTDRKACSIEIFNEIISLLTQSGSNKYLVHCLGGIGRTNMVLAGYLMLKHNISPSEAITSLKTRRKVIVTTEQIMFLKSYYGNICSNLSTLSTL